MTQQLKTSLFRDVRLLLDHVIIKRYTSLFHWRANMFSGDKQHKKRELQRLFRFRPAPNFDKAALVFNKAAFGRAIRPPAGGTAKRLAVSVK